MDESDHLKRLTAAIRDMRMAQKTSQDRFADKIKMHRAYYGTIERGSHDVTLLTLVRVANGLDVAPSEILRHAGL